MTTSGSLPASLIAEVFPTSTGSGPFPELQNARYQQPIGVCISGGGTRSMSAAIGQMAGLMDSNLLDSVGAISCVSGGSWFGTLFNFAPSSISDADLLGPLIPPSELTLDNIGTMPVSFLGTPIPAMTNSVIAAVIGVLEALGIPQNRIYSRMLNEILLLPFGLSSASTYFSLDATSVSGILANNPDLSSASFFTLRSGRPYFIAGATLVYPTGDDQVLRPFEYTPLYVGTPQLFSGAGAGGADIGGGYLQSFAFDSQTPTSTANPTTVTTPDPAFLLSDVMGSSGAAPGAILDSIGLPDLFPEFNYWPAVNVGNEASALYSITDGGNLENTGIIPLLRRQYPFIIAFFNSTFPIGSDDPSNVQGISGDISRLFGLIPEETLGNTQNTQVFPTEQFQDLVNGLNLAKNSGSSYFDIYTVISDNTFGIDSYEVGVYWFYNNMNQQWKDAIVDQDVLNLLASTDPTNFFANFPNYATVGQNQVQVEGVWVPELLMLTNQQVNLLANMWRFTVGSPATANALREASAKIAQRRERRRAR